MTKQNISIPCTGYSLTADWYKNAESPDILLTIPGYGSSTARNHDFLSALHAKTNLNILAVDLSGHGKSPFNIDETSPGQHLLEVVKTLDWLTAHNPEAKITVMGTSYGGFLCAYLTRYRDFHTLILRTPAIYLPSDLYSLQPSIDREYTSHMYRKDSQAVSRHPLFRQPAVFEGSTLLVVHECDEDVPKETTDIYRQAFSADEYIARGFRHSMRDPLNPIEGVETYQNAIANWISQ